MIFLKRYLILFILLIYISLVNAASFDVEVVPIDDRIAIDEFAKFQIEIKNNLGQADEYRIYNSNFPTWDVRTDPIVNPITLELEPGEKGSLELIVDPLKIKDIGTYAVNLNVRTKVLNQLKSAPLKVTVLSIEGLIGGYVPTVVTSVSIPEKIDPREEVPIKIVLNNQNIIDYEELVIKLGSNLIKDTVVTKLGPKEEKTLELIVNLDPLTFPQEDTLMVTVLREDKSIINPIARKIKIIEYGDLKVVSESKNFLVTKSNYKFVSNNPDYAGSFKIETTLFGSIFSSENPKAKVIKEDDKKYFVWDVELENNKMDVVVTKNILPLVFVIVLLIGLVFSYYIFRVPLIIRKESSSLVKSEGGVSEMSVILHIKNRAKSKIKDIEITETIPSIVSIERDISIGALQPTKVLRHEKRGTTIVKWSINHLDVSEERVLSYKIKTKLSILGDFSLPAATAVFKYEGKTLTTVSSRLHVVN
ncbi:hypothetical protein CMO93_04285 [Candidatus Woesearchaeota archaeon]|nr:hypothetical protein [Candidatus Woesearchaeota archaeon]|tara:strand:- start:20043 stop:21470 length:1428 start_codon:yes stop_codon:yes gene_type:complete